MRQTIFHGIEWLKRFQLFAWFIYVPASSSSSVLRSRAFCFFVSFYDLSQIKQWNEKKDDCECFQSRHFKQAKTTVWTFFRNKKVCFTELFARQQITELTGFVNISAIFSHEIYCIWKFKMMMSHRIKERIGWKCWLLQREKQKRKTIKQNQKWSLPSPITERCAVLCLCSGRGAMIMHYFHGMNFKGKIVAFLNEYVLQCAQLMRVQLTIVYVHLCL